MKAKVWSHVFLIVPIVIAFREQLFLYAGLVFISMIFSTFYHLSGEKRFAVMDKIFVYLVIGANLYLCYLANFKWPYFELALFFVLVGFYFFFFKKKDNWQWHIACALITLFCLLGYVM